MQMRLKKKQEVVIFETGQILTVEVFLIFEENIFPTSSGQNKCSVS